MSYVKTVWTNGVTKVNATNQGNNENATAQLAEFATPDSVVSQLINITTDSPTASIINLKIATTVSGGPITINRNGAGAKALLNPDGSAVDELSQDTMFFKVVDEPANFYLAPSGGANIKSIQNGYFDSSNFTQKDVAISAVNTDNSIILIEIAPNNGACREWAMTVEFTSGTNIRFKKGNSGGGGKVFWQVLEFNEVKSKQTGEETATGTTTITISSVDVTKCILFTTNRSLSTTTDARAVLTSVELTNPTTLTLRRQDGSSRTTNYQLLEFK